MTSMEFFLSKCNRQHRRSTVVSGNARGFTLLELVLALALSVMIVAVIASAIRLYFLNLTQTQKNLELTQLARNTLNLISGDIRSAMQFKPVDVSGLSSLISSETTAAVGAALGGNQEGGGELPEIPGVGAGGETGGENGLPIGGETGEAGSGTANATSAAAEVEVDRPRFFGTQDQIVFDISRLPRIDQYHPILHITDGGEYATLPTDVKTVSYYVSLSSTNASSTAGGTGLFRREVDRTSMMEQPVATAFEQDAASRPLASEVVELMFRYFDGESWQSSWDSDETGGFPRAVEVTMIIDPARLRDDPRETYHYSGFNQATMKVFRNVVHLPIAEILTAEEMELASDPFGGLDASGAAEAPAAEGAR